MKKLSTGPPKLANKPSSLIRERIQDLFNSPDKEFNRLGQLLCHQYRISYYIYAGTRKMGSFKFNPLFSLESKKEEYKADPEKRFRYIIFREEYFINLNKRENGNNNDDTVGAGE
jgi:hypothetical protein